MKRQTNFYTTVAILLAAVVGLFCLYQAFRALEVGLQQGEEDRTHIPLEKTPSLELDGETYHYNTGLRNYLLLGIDKLGPLVTTPNDYQQAGQSDTILLLSFRPENKTFFVMPINRDTMTTVVPYGPFGAELSPGTMQIALAYSYGNGGTLSGENAIRSARALLGNIFITGFFASPMNGVTILNDALGGITVTPDAESAKLNPAFVAGQPIRLQGEQALHFVRGRAGIGGSTNQERMARQTQFFSGLMQAAKGQDAEVLLDVYDQVAAISKTNLNSTDVADILSMLSSYQFQGIQSIAGADNDQGEYMEFYADEKALKEQLVRLFFTE